MRSVVVPLGEKGVLVQVAARFGGRSTLSQNSITFQTLSLHMSSYHP